MRKLMRPLLAALCVSGGGILGVMHEREGYRFSSYNRNRFGQVLHAKVEGYDETDGKNRRNVSPGIPAAQSKLQKEDLERRRREIMRFGYPSLDNIKYKDNYVLSYNRRLRQANWVCEHLNKDIIRNQEADRAKCDFVQDHEIHPLFRATNDDFRKTGYDRGHLAASANHRFSQDVNCQTFFLSNISPQVGSGFNRDAWQNLEKFEQDGHLYVKYKVIGKNNVAVPTHFFKVILTESYQNQFEIQSYILPNKPINEKIPLNNFQVPLERIEKASGLLIFEKLPRSKVREVRPVV
ncbi:endonuclease G, mitochondrial-like isoform X2 [Actinia tenebrosa]|uniref:Endonuclease n=1 Tax=Actinia tenebrosa TaxID=6105 RepID=A0A6P8IB79_ACTTE|nr:endonuclease G, mitochondrial-like isoform X2 [Actinia tenebrosa]